MRVRRLPPPSVNHRANRRFLPCLAATALLSGSALVLVPGSAAAALPPGCTQSGTIVSCTYTFTGATQTFTPPAGVTTVVVTLTGGSGGKGGDGPGGGVGGAGGLGAMVTGTLAGLTGQPLTVFVGGHGSDGAHRTDTVPASGGFGYGSGGPSGGSGGITGLGFQSGGGGGGGSALVAGTTPLAVASAGAGGGGAGAPSGNTGGAGGASDTNGSPAISEHPHCTQPGAAGVQPTPDGGSGTSALGFGDGSGGGGGGGVNGGAGGNISGVSGGAACGGGGGTSLAPTGGMVTDGVHSGDGQVTISYHDVAAEVAALQQTVQGVGSGTSLSDKLTTVQQDLAAGNVANACGDLSAFVNQVQAQAGKQIPQATADQLVASAQQLQTEIGC